MTPAAHVAAAIEILDAIFAGSPAEKALTGWARGHRFAGSKDRAALRDLVFQALRCRASYGWRGGAETGRGVMLGAMRAAGRADEVFTGAGYAPDPVGQGEEGRDIVEAPRQVQLDMPGWILTQLDQDHGPKAAEIATALKDRAGVFLRVNAAHRDADRAVGVLAQDEIEARPIKNLKNALEVIANEKKVGQSAAFQAGLVELQDPASQQAIDRLELTPGMRVLDYCAGGGGKALALAARGAIVTAHDIDARRMKDIAPRAARAGVTIAEIATSDLTKQAPFDLVLCDAPCSGSGTWRRTPEAKWALTPDRLEELCGMQDAVLAGAAELVRPGGVLAYATCSVLSCENATRVAAFEADSAWRRFSEMTLLPASQWDGFYLAQLRVG